MYLTKTFPSRLGLAVLAAIVMCFAAVAPRAHAAASTVNIVNLGNGFVVQADASGKIVAAVRTAGNFRQHFELENSSFGGKTLRLQGTNSCLAAPSTNPPSGDPPVVLTSCGSLIDGRTRWTLRAGIAGNGASQLVNVKTGQAMVPQVFGTNNPVLAPVWVADAIGGYGEWSFPAAQ